MNQKRRKNSLWAGLLFCFLLASLSSCTEDLTYNGEIPNPSTQSNGEGDSGDSGSGNIVIEDIVNP